MVRIGLSEVWSTLKTIDEGYYGFTESADNSGTLWVF